MQLAPIEVEVRPEKTQQLGDPQAGIDRRGDQGAIARRTSDQKADNLVAAEDALSAWDRMGALASLQPLNRIMGHPAVAQSEADDALKRRQRPGHRLLRLPGRPELGHQGGDVLDTDGADQAWTERWQQMPFEVIAVALERALTALAGFYPSLIALDPPPRDPGEAELWSRQRHAGAGRLDEERALRPRLLDVVPDSAETRPACSHETDRVLAVGLLIDALLHADS